MQQNYTKNTIVSRLLLASFTSITMLTSITTMVVPSALANAAQNDLSLAISPPVAYLSIAPGETYQHRLTLEHSGTTPLLVTPYLTTFSSDGETGQPQLDFNEPFPHYSFSVPTSDLDPVTQPNSFILEPNQRKNVAITFAPTSATPEKEYPLSLLFFAEPHQQPLNLQTDPDLNTQTQSLQQNPPSQTQIQAAVGSNIILLVSNHDRDRSNLQIESIKTNRLQDSLMPLSFTITAHNAGFNATQLFGTVAITNWRGEVVDQFDLYPDMILANTSRLLRTSTDETFTDAFKTFLNGTPTDPNTKQTFINALEKIDPTSIISNFNHRSLFLLGPYTITARISNNPQSSNTQFTDTTTQNTDTTTSDKEYILSTTVFALPYAGVALVTMLVLIWGGFQAFYHLQRNQ